MIDFKVKPSFFILQLIHLNRKDNMRLIVLKHRGVNRLANVKCVIFSPKTMNGSSLDVIFSPTTPKGVPAIFAEKKLSIRTVKVNGDTYEITSGEKYEELGWIHYLEKI